MAKVRENQNSLKRIIEYTYNNKYIEQRMKYMNIENKIQIWHNNYLYCKLLISIQRKETIQYRCYNQDELTSQLVYQFTCYE